MAWLPEDLLPALAQWLALLGIGGAGGYGVPHLVSALRGREKSKRTDLEKAWDAYDQQAKRRRVIEEHAHVLRRRMIQADCIPPEDIPPWPGTTGPIKKE